MFRRFSPIAACVTVAYATVCGLVLAGCERSAPVPPPADFIVATVDSAFWVTTDSKGIHVRSVPMTLFRMGGSFHELYVAEVDHSYEEALFLGERVYARNLVTGDSTLIYEDAGVVRLAAQYARTHPHARRAPYDHEEALEPEISAFGETEILDVRGSVLMIEHLESVEQPGGTQSDTARLAIDVRTSKIIRTRAELDSATQDSSAIVTLPRQWQRNGYALHARGDSGSRQLSLTLRDASRQSWPLITVAAGARLYWLDQPRVDGATRKALVRAFNGAASYNEAVKYVRHLFPRHMPLRAMPSPRVT
jgi:hypothetical protein